MSAVATTVLNTTELLEKILLHLDDIFELFAVQRVSRTFQNTIEGSMALKRKMGLAPYIHFGISEPLECDDILLEQIHPLLYPINMLDFGPFERKFSCPFDGCPDETINELHEPYIEPLRASGAEEQDHIQFSRRYADEHYDYGFCFDFLLRPGIVEKYQKDREFELGFTLDHSKDRAMFPHGSWRRARVCLVPKTVRIGGCVLVPRSICKRHGLDGQFCYREDREFLQGDVTLGELVDWLEEVRARSDEEHFARFREPDKYFVTEFKGGLYDGDYEEQESESEE